MEAIIFALLMQASSMVTKTGQSLMQLSQSSKLRKEAKGIAEQERQDTLLENKRETSLINKGLDLNEKKLSFQSQMNTEAIKDQNINKSFLFNKANKEQSDSLSSTLGINENTQAMKSRFLGRI